MIKQEGFWNSDKVGYSKVYKQFCIDCCNDENLFKGFRSNPSYNYIVGCDSHPSKLAEMFFYYVKNNHQELFEKFDILQKIDEIGGPPLYNFENNTIKISSNTLRYIKVLGDLINNYGNLDNFNIVEIGPGYGGQSVVISEIFKIKSYTYIDCVESINLIKKYTSHFNNTKRFFYNTDSIEIKEWDLVIADNSLSEMDSDGFDFYLQTILKNSKRAYMSMNDAYRKEQTVEKVKLIFPEIQVLKDEPVLNPNNDCYILIK